MAKRKNMRKIPYGVQLKKLIKDMTVLLNEQPNIGREVLGKMNNIISSTVEQYSQNQDFLTKNQFVAIVGSMAISSDIAFNIAKDFGFSKSNLKIFPNYEINTETISSITSQNCKWIIMGPSPHSNKQDVKEVFADKIIKVETSKKVLKITKESPINKTNEIPLTQSLNLARMIDHTLLKPEATRDEIKKLCDEARQYNFYSVCVNSEHVGYAAKLVTGSSTKAIAVVGFPLGAGTSTSQLGQISAHCFSIYAAI